MKKAKLFLSSLLMLLTVAVVSAQNVTVTGTVRDASTGEGVPSAAVIVKGTTTGVSSDADGSFSITVKKGVTLVFASVGYTSVEKVAVDAHIEVFLEQDSEFLDETIVVAYGVQRKSSFTGAAAQVSGEKLKKGSSTNISKSLEGAVAGLQTFSSSGTPGSGSSMLIRGIGSISASTSPLLVVDGVPYEGSLNSIASQDIESLTILKDAAANSMYGARGSNGVIIITTKKGTAGKVDITFDAKVGVNSRAVPAYDVITNPADYYEMFWEATRNQIYYKNTMSYAQAGLHTSAALIDEYLGGYNVYSGVANGDLIDPATGRINPNATTLKWNDDWTKDVFRRGIRQEYNLSAAGGNDNTRAYVSASYLSDEGYTPQSGFDRISLRAKVDHNVTSWLTAGLNMSFANTDQQTFGSVSNNFSNVFMFSQNVAPIFPIYKYDLETGEQLYGTKGEVLYDWGESRPYGANSNPLAQLLTSEQRTTRDNVSTRGYVQANLLKGLVFTANVAYDVFNTKSLVYTSPLGGDALSVNGRGEQKVSRYTALNANQLLNYNTNIGLGTLNVLVGHEIKSDSDYYLYGHKTNFVKSDISAFSNALTMQEIDSNESSYFLQGVFARAEYEYAGKYIVSASFRRDGSSRFAPERRWGSFWSVGASWNVKQEPFLVTEDEINALRFKISYGTQGNDNIGITKVYEDLYSITPSDNGASLTKIFRAAPEVTWEKSKNFNVGFETKVLDRLSISADYFVKQIDDMIYYRPLAPSQGSPSTQLVNDMDMQNKGIEFEIGLDLVKTRDFTWNVTLNGTSYQNTITKIPEDKPQEGYATGMYWREVGGSLYDYYMYDYLGVDETNGLPQYHGETPVLDEEGNPVLDSKGEPVVEDIIVNTTTEATRIKVGKSSIPDLYGGFTTSITWKNFDLSAAFGYQLGGWVSDGSYASLMSGGSAGSNWHKDIFNRWTPENTQTDVPRVEVGNQEIGASSTRFLTNASYISLRNFTVGYTLPGTLTQKIGAKGLRVFLTGDNVWYLSHRRGLDVRQGVSGDFSTFNYSALRTVSAGVSLTF